MFSRNIIYRMGLFGWLGGAAHSIRGTVGSFGNDVDNTLGYTNNWGDSINTPYKIVTTPAFGVEGGNTWGYNPDGKYDPDRKYGIGTSVFMAEVNQAHHKSITEQLHSITHNSKHIPHVQPSESKHNTTHHKKK